MIDVIERGDKWEFLSGRRATVELCSFREPCLKMQCVLLQYLLGLKMTARN